MDKRLFPVTPVFFKDNIKPLIESGYSRAGRPPSISDYHVFCAMLYVLRTGIPWRDLPACYGHWHRVYQRFKRSSDRGVWWKIVLKLQSNRKLTLHIVLGDSTTFKVHRHGGGLKGGQQTKGTNRAGVTTKLHLAVTAEGHVIEGFLSAGNTSDITVADSLFEDVFGCYVVLDMGYDSDPFRDVLRSQNNTPVIPGRKNRKVKIEYDKAIYKLRKRIEQFFGKLKENKRLAMRYEKSDTVFLAFIALGIIMTLI